EREPGAPELLRDAPPERPAQPAVERGWQTPGVAFLLKQALDARREALRLLLLVGEKLADLFLGLGELVELVELLLAQRLDGGTPLGELRLGRKEGVPIGVQLGGRGGHGGPQLVGLVAQRTDVAAAHVERVLVLADALR